MRRKRPPSAKADHLGKSVTIVMHLLSAASHVVPERDDEQRLFGRSERLLTTTPPFGGSLGGPSPLYDQKRFTFLNFLFGLN